MASLDPHTGTLGIRLAKHLLRRSTYRYTKEMIDSYALKTVDAAVNDLFLPYTKTMAEPLDYKTGQPWINSGIEPDPTNNSIVQRRSIVAWWMGEALLCPTIQYKMQWFLHAIFVTDHLIGASREFYDYLILLEYYSTGNIRDFAEKMSKNPLMLRYLSGTSSTSAAPNENYAREFLELFTITKGPQIGPGDYTNYTEADVQTAAKVLTGWQITTRILGMNPTYKDIETNTQLGFPNYSRHTTGNKTFSSAFGLTQITGATNAAGMHTELAAFVTMVFSKDQTAISYAKRLYRYFVSDKIDTAVYNDIIVPLGAHLKANNYDLTSTVKLLLKSKHFYDKDNALDTDNIIGSIFRSPLEQVLQALTFFKVSTPDPITNKTNHYTFFVNTLLVTIFPVSSIDPFSPENVAGYSAYYQEPGYSRNWFNSGTMIARYKLYDVLTSGKRVFNNSSNGGVVLNVTLFVKNSGYFSAPQTADTLVTELCNYLLPEVPNADRMAYYLGIFLDELSPINWMNEWNNYISSNNDSSVKIPIGRLLKVLLSSQEFQLS